jgi:hypothetical protein
VIKAKTALYRRYGKPWHRPRLQNLDDYDIARTYAAEYRDGASLYPSPVSSPWMRRYPHPGLSRAISITRTRIACAMRGRPGVRRGYAHRLLTRSACHRSRVRREMIRRT